VFLFLYNLATTTHLHTHARTHARAAAAEKLSSRRPLSLIGGGATREIFSHSKKHKAKKKKKINLKTLNKPPGDEKNIKSSATRVFSLSL
jgi:hypothetical protein